ncbi:zinc finger MYM-type protein 1-like, partial [Aphis craccivora]
NAIAYIAGWASSKLSHIECVNELATKDKDQLTRASIGEGKGGHVPPLAFPMHRTQCDRHLNNIFETIKKTTNDLDIEIKIPRLSNKQTNRSNHNVTTLEQYYRVSLFLPYLDSLINSLESRFTQSNEIPFKISNLHPSEVIKLSKSDFICTLKNIKDLFNIDNLIEEGNTWYDYWDITENSTKINEESNISYYLKDCEFFPSVKKCIIIYMTIPPTTCTIERSFSTLRRVKTWLRSTITEQRLSGLCILSIHRQKIDDLNLIQGVVDEFSKNKRNLQFLF